jgi:hypothetical protein
MKSFLIVSLLLVGSFASAQYGAERIAYDSQNLSMAAGTVPLVNVELSITKMNPNDPKADLQLCYLASEIGGLVSQFYSMYRPLESHGVKTGVNKATMEHACTDVADLKTYCGVHSDFIIFKASENVTTRQRAYQKFDDIASTFQVLQSQINIKAK